MSDLWLGVLLGFLFTVGSLAGIFFVTASNAEFDEFLKRRLDGDRDDHHIFK